MKNKPVMIIVQEVLGYVMLVVILLFLASMVFVDIRASSLP
jgi:hypothetical protein